MEEVEQYKKLKYYFRRYIEMYPEFEDLSYNDIDEIFVQMLEHMVHIANTYLGD